MRPGVAAAAKLRTGGACRAGLQATYLRSRWECRRGRLRRASLVALRRGEAVLIDRRGHIDRRNALEAFATAVAPLPGIRPRRGAVGAVRDASSVVRAVMAQRRELTLAQRAVVDRVLEPGPTAAASAVGPAERQAFADLAVEARRRISAHGYSFAHGLSIGFPDTDVIPGAGGKAAPAWTVAGWLDPDPATANQTCNVFVAPSLRASVLADQRAIMAHELFHCAQDEHFATVSQEARVPQWVIEGGAAWAGNTVGREWNGVDTPRGGDWNGWLQHPETDLGVREYTAIGFFSLLEQSGIDVWQRMHDVLRAGGLGGDFPAYGAATAGVTDLLFASWGPSYVRQPSRGAAWDLRGPGLFSYAPPPLTVADNTSFRHATDRRGAFGTALDLRADVIEVSVLVKQGLLSTNAGESPLRDALLCTRAGGCSCEGEPLDARQVPKGAAAIGWFDGEVSLQGRSLERECRRRGAPDAPKPGDGGQAQGIMLFQKSIGDGNPIVTRFRSGSCSTRGGFSATARSGGYTLRVRIPGFSGFHRYAIPFNGSGARFTVDGPRGPFSNVYFPGGTPPPAGGAIEFGDRGRRMGLGFINAFNAGGSDSIALAGVMSCRFARR